MTQAAIAVPVRLLGLVTNSTGDNKIRKDRRWGFIQTEDGRVWHFSGKDVVSYHWPQEGDEVSFVPSADKAELGKNPSALSVIVTQQLDAAPMDSQ